jgi:hypothetical protein
MAIWADAARERMHSLNGHTDIDRVEILALPDHRLALMRLRGDVTTPQLLAAIRAAYVARPDAAGYHLVNDLRSHTGHLGVEGIKAATAVRFDHWPHRTPGREVILTRDPGMIFVARYLDVLAPHMAHSISTDPAEAIARCTGGPVPEEALAFLNAR